MTQENSNVTSTGIVSTLFAYTLMLSILFALLWNWDGFWQTNIQIQLLYFENLQFQEHTCVP